MSNETTNNAQDYPDDPVSGPAVRRLQLVRAGWAQFGIFAEEIATIVAWRNPTPLPQAPKSVLGLASVQGRMLTVLELASLTGVENASTSVPQETPNQSPPYLVALRGDEQLALAVDDVDGVIELTAEECAELRETVGTPVLGVLQRTIGEINVLDLEGLFPAAIQGRERRRRRF